jgi:hypothetical protein
VSTALALELDQRDLFDPVPQPAQHAGAPVVAAAAAAKQDEVGARRTAQQRTSGPGPRRAGLSPLAGARNAAARGRAAAAGFGADLTC